MFGNNTGINIGGLPPLNGSNNSSSAPKSIGGLNLSKGMSLNLEKFTALKEVEFGLGWTENHKVRGGNFDLDASALILKSNNRVQDSGDVIYFNQLNTGRGVVSEGDDRSGSEQEGADCEVINVKLDEVPSYCESVKIIVTIFDAVERGQNFGMVNNAYIVCRDKATGQELAKYTLSDEFAMNISVEMGELRKTARGWEFKALGKGSHKDLLNILIEHGVQ